MKKLLFVLVVACATLSSTAQITYNAKLGLGLSSCKDENYDVTSVDQRFVAKMGLGIEKPLSSSWSLMPSLEFAKKGAKLNTYSGKKTFDVYYLQVPILAAYRFNFSDKLNIVPKAGPYFAYGLFGTVKDKNESYGIFGAEGKRFEVGLDAGVDFEFKRYVIGAEYEFGFTEIYLGAKNQAFYVTLGYKF